MKYLITYNYDDWGGDFTDEAIETCDTVEEVENIIYNIKKRCFYW